MKSNLLYIFDKITTTPDDEGPSWRSDDRPALIDRATAIGLSDRGADIGPHAAARLAEALLEARNADRGTLLHIRRSLEMET